MPSPLLVLPLELRHEIFSALICTPHTIDVSFSTLSDAQSPLNLLSRTSKQLYHEISAWCPPTVTSSCLDIQPFGLITPHTTITFHLSLRNSPILISKTPKNLPEAAIFQLWAEIMLKLDTGEIEIIDREIRDRFDAGDARVNGVLEGIYDDVIDKRWADDVRIYGGNRYLVIAAWFWGRNRCVWEEG